MSDLAPFVAAVIRDRVVADLVEENRHQAEEIRRLQAENASINPYRTLQIKTPRLGSVLESTLHVERVQDTVERFNGRHISMFPHPLEQDNPPFLSLDDFFKMELWIDGSSAVRFADLSYHYQEYSCDNDGEDNVGPVYYMKVAARDEARSLNMDFFLCHISPEDHARILQRDSPVDFVLPDDLSVTWSALIEGQGRANDALISKEELFKNRSIIVRERRESWTISGEFFLQHLIIPYTGWLRDDRGRTFYRPQPALYYFRPDHRLLFP